MSQPAPLGFFRGSPIDLIGLRPDGGDSRVVLPGEVLYCIVMRWLPNLLAQEISRP